MSNITLDLFTVHFTPSTGVSGKLADAELHFTPEAGPLAGLKLIGFGVWAPRGGRQEPNVTFPARQYSVNGERRAFALLRPQADISQQLPIKHAILDAYAVWASLEPCCTAMEPDGACREHGHARRDSDEPSGYKPEGAVLYDGTPGSATLRRR